jgi:hypothetical protein
MATTQQSQEKFVADIPNLDLEELARIKAIASSADDDPVLMLNFNRYVPEANYPSGTLYQSYRAAMARFVEEVGGKIL